MSAIFGLVRRDGREVTEAELATIREPMEYWGAQGGGCWHEGCAGLGQLVAYRTPEDVHEVGPITIAGGGAIVAPAGRLDNREELLAALDVPVPDRPLTPDGRLMALAYERWGDSAPNRIRGDWAFAVWQPRERRLTLARDHYGHTALYWYRNGPMLAFASSVKGLLALPEIPHRLNEVRFAEALVLCIADGESSMYEGIRRLPTARMLTFDEGGVRVREYWSLSHVPELRLESDVEYVERFLELFGCAVRTRLRANGAVATTLSAGLDSAAVTSVAARALGPQPITAYTARPAYPEVAADMPDLLVDEWPRARLVAKRYSNLRHAAVRGEHESPVAALKRSLWVHDEPEHAVPNLPWVTALLDQAREDGHVALLTGQMGNCSVSWHGDSRRLLAALASGDVADVLRALRHARELGRGGWTGALWRGLVLPIRELVATERMRREPARAPGVATSVIGSEFAARMDVIGHVKAAARDPYGVRASARERRLDGLRPGLLPVTGWWHQRSAAHGIDVRDPTIDVPLLEFAVGTPEAQYARDGKDRWLMRRGLQGLVPAEIAWNRQRGAQGADIAYRLRADADAVSTAVGQLAAADLVRHYLDVALIERSWSAVLAGGSEGVLELSRGLLAGLFLLRFA